MIPVSIIDGEYMYGVDYSNKGADVIYISPEDMQKINNGDAYLNEGQLILIDRSDSLEEDLSNKKKADLISRIQYIQQISLNKRLEYTTVRDMLPEGNQIREMKLDKLAYEGDQILIEFETLVKELLTEYGEYALADII